MKRWLWLILCLIGSVLTLALGILTPAHLRAVNKEVAARAGAGTPGVVERGVTLAREGQLGPAEMMLQAARIAKLTNTTELEITLAGYKTRPGSLIAWGVADSRLEALFWADFRLTNGVAQPLADVLVRLENRGKVLSYLRVSPRPAILELLRTRALTNTVLFPPATSASGQAYDAAIAICGMLMDRGQLNPKLTDAIHKAASLANSGQTEPLEELLMDLLALGQRLNFGQLVLLLDRVEAEPTLRGLAALSRSWEQELPLLYAMVQVSGMPSLVASYASKYQDSTRRDFAQALALRSGAAKELLARGHRLHEPKYQGWAMAWEPSAAYVREAADYALLLPWVTLAFKGLLYLLSGFLLALGVHCFRRAPSGLEAPLHVPRVHVAREALFGIGFMLFIVLVNEPHLTSAPQKPEPRIRLRLPTAAAIAPSGQTMVKSLMMTQSLLTLLLFFVLQALLYTACLVKLAEIRRQQVPASTKLKLLDNEDHLFDAGLYLGFAGTIISLILVSMGVAAPSLMAAYSSTSFGIIFVSVFKIFNLRPLRRRLLMESETAGRAGTVSEPDSWATQS